MFYDFTVEWKTTRSPCCFSIFLIRPVNHVVLVSFLCFTFLRLSEKRSVNHVVSVSFLCFISEGDYLYYNSRLFSLSNFLSREREREREISAIERSTAFFRSLCSIIWERIGQTTILFLEMFMGLSGDVDVFPAPVPTSYFNPFILHSD